MYKAWNSAQAKSSTAIWDCFSLWGNCLAALSSSAAKDQWCEQVEIQRQKHKGDIRSWGCAECVSWQQFRSHHEVAKSCLLKVSSCKREQAGVSTQWEQGQAPAEQRQLQTQTHNPKPELLCSWLPDWCSESELDALFFEFCTVAMNTESGPQQSQAPFRAIHTKYHFEHWSNSPCPAPHAFKELWAHHFSEKLPGFLIIIIQSWFFPGPTDLFKHSQSPVEESRLLTSTLLIWSSPQIKNNSRQL